MIELDIRDLHLAAYMRYHGAKLVNMVDGKFVFDSVKPLTQWRIEHSASDCFKIDRELMSLKRMINDKE
jgi:hypothetical protein